MTYRQKNKLLIAGLIAGACIIYMLSIKKTLTLISDVHDYEQKINQAKDAPAQSKQLEEQITAIDRQIGAFSSGNENKQQSLLDVVTAYCQSSGAILREFPEARENNEDAFIIATNYFVVQGNFSSLLSLVHLLEQHSVPGKIVSVDYSLKKDLKTREMALTATIYLQNIRKK